MCFHTITSRLLRSIVYCNERDPDIFVCVQVNLNKIITQIKQKNTNIGAPFYSLAFGTGADYNFLQVRDFELHGIGASASLRAENPF